MGCDARKTRLFYVCVMLAIALVGFWMSPLRAEASTTQGRLSTGYITIDVEYATGVYGTYRVEYKLSLGDWWSDKIQWDVIYKSGSASNLLTGSGISDTDCDGFCPVHGTVSSPDPWTHSSRQYNVAHNVRFKTRVGYTPVVVRSPSNVQSKFDIILANDPARPGTGLGTVRNNTNAMGMTNFVDGVNYYHDRYTLRYSPHTYTINYHGNGNSGGSTSAGTYTYDVTGTIKANGFSKTGYRFIGWNTAPDGSGTSYQSGANVLNWTSQNGASYNLYARWAPIDYTITYHGNGSTSGSTATSAHLYDNSLALTANGFRRDYTISLDGNGGSCATTSLSSSYTFRGWATTATGGVAYTNRQSVRNLTTVQGANLTLYALWNPTAVSLPTATRPGYTFGGWTTARNTGTGVLSYTPTQNTTLYARWVPNQYTLSYQANNPSAVADVSLSHTSQTGSYDAPWGTLAGASKPGYTFNGWFTQATGGTRITEATVCNGDLTVYGQWTVNTYTLTYRENNPNGASDVVLSKTSQVGTYEAPWGTLATATKEGYRFLGWFTQATGGTLVTEATICKGDQTVYAQWMRSIYTVTYVENNPATALVSDDIYLSKTSQTGTHGEPWGTLATATKTGYLFEGWYTKPLEGTKLSESTICNGDLTVYAHWKPITYTIRFHPNTEYGEGIVTGTMPDVVCTYDQVQVLPKNQYTKTMTVPAEEEGGEITQIPTVFVGWNAVPESLTAACLDEASLLNLTGRQGDIIDFYAIWDDAPTFVVDAYPDRYFTLEEAQAGVITEWELLQTVVVYDRETNPLPKKDSQAVQDSGNDIGVTLVGYQAEDFTALTDDAIISVRYKVTDAAGNQTFLSISVFVSRNGHVAEEKRTYYRSISDDYVDKAASEGGLADGSYWRKQTPEEENAYADLLRQALSENPTTAYDLYLNKQQLEEIRNHVADQGFGNVANPNGLEQVWNILTPDH